MRRRTSTAAACLAGALLSCAGRGSLLSPPGREPECRGQARALAAALRALATSGDPESPRGIAAGLVVDPVCPGGGSAGRVRCHLERPTTEVTSRCARGAWVFTVTMPELSDHVHRAEVSRRPGGALAVRVESEN